MGMSFPFMALWYRTIQKYHFVFVHSSVDGHLECLDLLAVVNSAVVNYVYTFFFLNICFQFFLYIYSGKNCCVTWYFCVNFEEPPNCFPQAAVLFYILTSNMWVFLFLYILTNTLLISIFSIIVILVDGKVVFYCAFDLHSPSD